MKLPLLRWTHCVPVRAAVVALMVLTMFLAPLGAQDAKKKGPPKPKPDLADVKYGPHMRNVLDLWQARSDTPTPLVVFIHGGGFRAGSKEGVPVGLLSRLLANGISVMAINYRLSPEVSYPAHYLDSARSIQFARSKAKEWNLDPKRVGSTGGSAGAGTSLWIGFHDDLADANNTDPVLRQSTRLTCMAVNGAQSSYDPRVIRAWVGEAAARHPALPDFFGVKSNELDSPRAHKLYEAASAINYLTRDDPPVYAFYSEARVIPADAKDGQGIHHINFGLRLKTQMDAFGIECIVRHRDEGAEPDKEMAEFFVRQLTGKAAKSKSAK
ncbi:MAG: alpha/beta hydrolase [Opitutus sp.]|nr:alpha/beta hydrolase [Opitutus sp.]